RMAAGLEIDVTRIDALRAALNEHAAQVMDAQTLRPVVTIDATAGPRDLTPMAVRALRRLAPHGQANPRPVIALQGWTLLERPRIMKERHLKLNLSAPDGTPLAALGWNMAEHAEALNRQVGQPLDVAGSPTLNTWNGRESVELEIKAFRPSE